MPYCIIFNYNAIHSYLLNNNVRQVIWKKSCIDILLMVKYKTASVIIEFTYENIAEYFEMIKYIRISFRFKIMIKIKSEIIDVFDQHVFNICTCNLSVVFIFILQLVWVLWFVLWGRLFHHWIVHPPIDRYEISLETPPIYLDYGEGYQV